MQDKELFTISDFLTRYSISRSSLYREIAAGRLRMVKRGRRSLITRDDAEAWRNALPEAKEVLKGADTGERCQPFIYTPRHAAMTGATGTGRMDDGTRFTFTAGSSIEDTSVGDKL